MPSTGAFNVSLTFDSKRLGNNLDALGPKVDEKIHAVVDYQARKGESDMKTNAKWTDRTGNARNGLSAIAVWNRGESHIIRLFHRVSYGIFLETRWAGRFAIILPTIQKLGPDTMRMLQGLLNRLGRGGL